MRVRLATKRKSLGKFNLRPLGTTCQSVCPGLKKMQDKILKSKRIQRQILLFFTTRIIVRQRNGRVLNPILDFLKEAHSKVKMI